MQAAAAAAQPAVRADQHAEARGVDERRVGEVDHHAPDVGRDRRHHALLELRRGEEVDLAGDGDDVRVAVEPAVLDRELERHPLVRAAVGEPQAEVLRAVLGLDLELVRRAARSTLPTPGTAASTTSARAPPSRSGPTRRSSARGVEPSSTSTVSAATWAGARAAIRSAISTASSSRSSGRSARAATIPTTRRSTGPTSGPLAMETRVGAPAALTRAPARTTSRGGCRRGGRGAARRSRRARR